MSLKKDLWYFTRKIRRLVTNPQTVRHISPAAVRMRSRYTRTCCHLLLNGYSQFNLWKGMWAIDKFCSGAVVDSRGFCLGFTHYNSLFTSLFWWNPYFFIWRDWCFICLRLIPVCMVSVAYWSEGRLKNWSLNTYMLKKYHFCTKQRVGVCEW